MKNLSFLVIILILLGACNSEKTKTETDYDFSENRGNESLLAINASQYGVKYPETFVLQQNRRGLRIEYCIDRSALQLWISPQAGKDFTYRLRNWSNRDNHTRVFRRIIVPGLRFTEFDSCDYDPFHSKLFYKNNVLHIAQVYDKPIVLLWFDQGGKVNLKSGGGDKELSRDDRTLAVIHTDRGKKFEYAAVIGEGAGTFQHQLVLDEFRSIHARAHLDPGQVLAIGAEFPGEGVLEFTRTAIKPGKEAILRSNEEKITGDLYYGQFQLRDRPEMQKLLDINRRIALSLHDYKGFMRSTNQYIYYLLWFRDGGMNTSHMAYSGWTRPAREHCYLALENPNISYEDPPGEFYGQLMAGPITKWEEDGLFYVVWPTFSHWAQTGDDALLTGEHMNTLDEANDWLEDYIYDEKQGLLGRYHYCETPLTGSRGDGYDNATGAPTWKWNSKYKDTTIIRAYDLYINALQYGNYMMLAAMQGGNKAQKYIDKANALEKGMMRFYEMVPLPSYGDLITEDGRVMKAEPYGMDRWDYLWALSLPPFYPNMPEYYYHAREQLFRDMRDDPTGYFICCYAAVLTSMDPELHSEDSILAALDYLVPQSVEPGKYLPMPYTIPELINVADGHPFHDVRPLVYSIAPWLSAVTNLGLRRMPFGIAVRGTKHLEVISNYRYLDGEVDVFFEGTGRIKEVLVNGQKLKGSWQIPDQWLREDENKVVVRMATEAEHEDLLIGSTVRLGQIEQTTDGTLGHIRAHGKNILTFKNLDSKVSIMDENGAAVELTLQQMREYTYVEFDGIGRYSFLVGSRK